MDALSTPKYISVRNLSSRLCLTRIPNCECCTVSSLTDVCDGAMIVLAFYTLNFFHPGFLLGKANVWTSRSKTPSEADSEIQQKSHAGVDKV